MLIRQLLELIGHFFYLPFVPAVMVTAMLTRRGPTAVAVGLSIAANVALVPREGVMDALINALLFTAVSWLIGSR